MELKNWECDKSDFADYTEKLIPTRVTITKRCGNVTRTFDIDGYRGAETGQIYYKGKGVLEVEQISEARQCMLMSESSLAKIWDTPEEDEAWKDL